MSSKMRAKGTADWLGSGNVWQTDVSTQTDEHRPHNDVTTQTEVAGSTRPKSKCVAVVFTMGHYRGARHRSVEGPSGLANSLPPLGLRCNA